MTPRVKKLIGFPVLLAGLILYVGAAATLADHVPKHWLAKLLYFVVTGLAWAVPAAPLIAWMNRERGNRN